MAPLLGLLRKGPALAAAFWRRTCMWRAAAAVHAFLSSFSVDAPTRGALRRTRAEVLPRRTASEGGLDGCAREETESYELFELRDSFEPYRFRVPCQKAFWQRSRLGSNPYDFS